jgi:hypothetical protein
MGAQPYAGRGPVAIRDRAAGGRRPVGMQQSTTPAGRGWPRPPSKSARDGTIVQCNPPGQEGARDGSSNPTRGPGGTGRLVTTTTATTYGDDMGGRGAWPLPPYGW